MADRITIKGMRARSNRFLKCKSLEDLAILLRTNPLKLFTIGLDPNYQIFYIPKKNGKKRLIEDPVRALKKIQRKLNNYLQAVYHFHRTTGAYGFLSNPVDDPSPRHILTNAQMHLGCTWMVNVDMKDFFHLINQERVQEIFEAPLFGFQEALAKFLAALVCFKGRLPMGAPTSPIITNIACIPLDQDLADYATDRDWKYTRYADDITFSGKTEITNTHIQEIKSWVEVYDLKLNPAKQKLFGPDDGDKEVTGLIIGRAAVDLPSEYLENLRGAIHHLSQVVDAKCSVPTGIGHKTVWLKELEQKVGGKLEFARQILGEDDDVFIELEKLFVEALEPPENFGPLNWLDIGYSLLK